MKSAFKSKLNWVGALILLTGLFMDPTFQGYCSDIVPAQYMSKIVSLSGIVVMVLRTFFTSEPVSFKTTDTPKQ